MKTLISAASIMIIQTLFYGHGNSASPLVHVHDRSSRKGFNGDTPKSLQRRKSGRYEKVDTPGVVFFNGFPSVRHLFPGTLNPITCSQNSKRE